MHYVALYPQNGDRIVTIDSVTSPPYVYMYVIYTFAAIDNGPNHIMACKAEVRALPSALSNGVTFSVRIYFVAKL